MRLSTNLLAALLFLLTDTQAFGQSRYFPSLGVTIMLADSSAGAAAVAQRDDYTRLLTPFDLSIRMDREDATVDDYLRKAAENTRGWTRQEEDQLQASFVAIDNYLKDQHISLKLPDTIKMIKTIATEEFGAEGWTRRNLIMLNAARPAGVHLVAHELFHVISRHHRALQDAVYAVFGFVPCNDVLYRSEVPYAITNPDAPYLSHYVSLKVREQRQDAVLLLYSKSGYRKGMGLQDYAAIGLLLLAGGDKDKRPQMKDGVPVILELDAVPDLFNKIGTNTQYVLHPEEIAAEHFAALVTGKSYPEEVYLTRMKEALQVK